MREFDTGATRDDDDGKLDYEGFLSPSALKRYAEYMHEHRKQADGKMRDSDNWQKGIPIDTYMKSMFRHMMDLWIDHRGYGKGDVAYEALCAIIFNAFGYLHELEKFNGEIGLSTTDNSPPPSSEVKPDFGPGNPRNYSPYDASIRRQ